MQPYAPPPPPPPAGKSKTVWIVIACVVAGIVIFVGLQVFQASSVKYMKKEKKTEAEVMLRAIEKAAKRVHDQTGAFPVGSAPLTPEGSCCEATSQIGKCDADPGAWTGVWEELMFSVDEPQAYRYSYQGTADHFVAQAVADLDCDAMELTTYTLESSAVEGVPRFELTKPAKFD